VALSSTKVKYKSTKKGTCLLGEIGLIQNLLFVPVGECCVSYKASAIAHAHYLNQLCEEGKIQQVS
jgi:hypothetical protein